MASHPETSYFYRAWALGITRAMELLWLLTVFLVPLTFMAPEWMANGFVVPKVTLYRSLVGIIYALWLIERGLRHQRIRDAIPLLSLSRAKGWLPSQPTRWILVVAGAVLVSHLISTLLSSSITVSLWGQEPASDGNSLYNTFSHFMLFLVIATHLKTMEQLWRLMGTVIASGLLVGLYAGLQFYGLDPFGVFQGVGGVVSSLGNPIFVGAFLLMVVPMTLALGLNSHGATAAPARIILSIAGLAILLLGMAFTQARGPWAGLAVALVVFLVAVFIAIGWRASLRGLLILAAASALTWGIVTFIPAQLGRADIVPRALSARTALVSSLKTESSIVEPLAGTATNSIPTSMETRLILWKGATQMALHRPWFQPEDRPLLTSLQLFGYGPGFFQYIFPLIHPRELVHLNNSSVYYGVKEPHNYTLNRWVELGFFGLASFLVLLCAVTTVSIRMIFDKGTTTQVNQRLVMSAVLASVVGRMVEQLVGIPHVSDEALFWTLLAVAAALPRLTHAPSQTEVSLSTVRNSADDPQSSAATVRPPALQISLALVLASLVLGFTLVKNTNYALAEHRATSAAALSDDGRLEIAMQSIDSAIALASDVGRYHVIRANILDQARNSTASESDRARLAMEAYQANRRAVISNPFDMYSRLNFAESALTLATLGQSEKGEEAIEEYRRLTVMQPRFWLSHFLLGRAYMETGEPDRAVESLSEAMKLDPLSTLIYDRRAEATEY